MADLTLYGESGWTSPWVLHAMVALEEMRLPYRLELPTLPFAPALREDLQRRAVIGKVPMLAHGATCITESSAISEYLAETFPSTKGYPRLFPADLGVRARARQIMSWLRTSLFALREDRPTTSVFARPARKPMSDKGKADAAELVRVATAVITSKQHMFDAWCIADADLALALMRLVANEDPVPELISQYALAQFQRPSIRKFLSYVPTQR
jgi:glutathione S-transferase